MDSRLRAKSQGGGEYFTGGRPTEHDSIPAFQSFAADDCKTEDFVVRWLE